MIKKRLDLLIKDLHPHLTRNQIQILITQKQVLVNGIAITKSGSLIQLDASIELLTTKPTYVSRAGLKLEAALKHFNINVHNLVILDAGISTGGFTDCLLQHGAKKIYGVDVGTNQVHEKIRFDERVVVFENTNLKNLTTLPEPVDLITLDLSFISLLKVMPAVIKLLKPEGKIIALIKPQFELARHHIGRGGIVKDETLHQQVLEKIKNGMQNFGLTLIDPIESPILGSSGNKEFLGLLTH